MSITKFVVGAMICNILWTMKAEQERLKAMFPRASASTLKKNPHFGASVATDTSAPLRFSDLKPRAKYRNVKVEYQGMMFDSGHELDCWKNLKLREKAGEIEDLKRQVKFELVVNGHRVGKITMDFTWLENDGRGPIVVADAKSEITRKETAYRLRKRIFEALYHPLTIREL